MDDPWMGLAGIRITGFPRDTREGEVRSFVEKYGNVEKVVCTHDDHTKTFIVELKYAGDQTDLPEKISKEPFRSRTSVTAQLINVRDETEFPRPPLLYDPIYHNTIPKHPMEPLPKR